MEITIKADAKEIAALVVALQERRIEPKVTQTPKLFDVCLGNAEAVQAEDGTRIGVHRINLS